MKNLRNLIVGMKDRCTTRTAKGTILSLLLTTCAAFTACTDKSEELVPQGTRALDVQVKVQPTSRAMVKGTALAEGAGLGVNVTATDGGLYDGKDAGYLNILYTATGTGGDQKWNSTTPVMLSGTEGKMYAYYPHTPGVDFKAIAVDITAQHDWMYSAEAYTVSDKSPSVAVTLKHAQTAVNVNVVRDATYTGVGAVSALTVTSEGLASGGTLDTRDGAWSALSGANTAISIIGESFTLDGSTKSSQENPYMFIPASGETKDFVVTATVDGKTYNSSVTMKEAFTKGKVYSVNLKMTNVGLTVSEVTLVDWDEVLLNEGTFQPGLTADKNRLQVTFYINSHNGRAINRATSFPDGSQVGARLSGYTGCENLMYTASTGKTPQIWIGDKDVVLSDVTGTLYAFYPYDEDIDITAIPVDMTAADQTDWLYGVPATGITDLNPKVDVTMNHALANISLSIVRDSYVGNGEISSISVQSDGIALKGTFNATQTTPSYTAFTGKGEALERSVNTTLGATATDIMVIPTGTEAVITFFVTVDNVLYTVKSAPFTLEMGNSYQYTLKLNSTFMSLTSITIIPWEMVSGNN